MNRNSRPMVLVYIAAALLVACGIALVVLGGWEAGWWFTNQNANRQAHVIRSGYSNQQTLRDQITRKIGDVASIDSQISGAQKTSNGNEVAVLTAQRHAVADIVCADAEQITGDPLPSDQESWISNNCVIGSAK